MIERYSITASSEKISERFSVNVPPFYAPHYNAGTTQLLPVITIESPEGISNFYWGTSPEWAKNKALSEKIVNIRAETILDKPAIRKAMMKARCIIPADGFYAWKRAGKKSLIPFRFVRTDEELFSFAGLWEEYEDTDGNEFHTFTLITTLANALVASVCERMPAMLDKTTEKIWLNKNSSEDELLQTLQPYPAAQMNHYTISPRIYDQKSNVPSLIMPAPPADQFGNLTLFD